MDKTTDEQKPLPERIITPMSKDLVEAVDDFRFQNRHKSRSEAIRRLIQAGLDAEAARRRNK